MSTRTYTHTLKINDAITLQYVLERAAREFAAPPSADVSADTAAAWQHNAKVCWKAAAVFAQHKPRSLKR